MSRPGPKRYNEQKYGGTWGECQESTADSTGYYHIILRGNERKNIFLDDEDCKQFIGTLAKKKNKTGFFIYAYCLMDNHNYLLLKDE
ncbi:MAG TPA: hypothetical protein DEF36_20835 [Desulfotomaculum sp.]|nr:hypothetical protein [Desulfotomaculum sp.]